MKKLTRDILIAFAVAVGPFAQAQSQEGMTADITIFDPETVTDNASWEEGKNTLPSTGIPYVIVHETIVVKDSEVQRVTPGVPIRNAVQD